MTKDELIAFEREIADLYNAGQIRAPIHLSGGNEDALLSIFKGIRQDDWVCTTWRSHYHCLLKGVPPDEVRAAILAGRSISLCFPEYRVVSSAIAGGIMPIALGIAWEIKRTNGDEIVWCFVGDMAAEMGIAHECLRYANNHELPVNFIVEDNGISVGTSTLAAWGALSVLAADVTRYTYELLWPHSGTGKRVEF